MGLFGTGADLATDALIVVEAAITVAILVGVFLIRRNKIRRHRLVMLSTLAFNAAFLVYFLIQDAIKASSTIERGLPAPAAVFWPVLIVHLAFAFTAFGVAVAAWRIARRGYRRDDDGVVSVDATVRRQHRRVAQFYPYLWAVTLLTGILLYNVVYVLF